MSERQLLEAIAVTAEMTGTQLSPGAAKAMFDDLKRYPEHQVLGALVSCRRQLQHRLTLADILARLEDGRPGPEEAWATVAQTKSEATTLVWTDEMRLASGVAWPLICEEDMVAARMAFLETYRKLVQQARDVSLPVRWTVSLGTDVSGRDGPLLDAVAKGRLTHDQVQGLLPQQQQLSPPLVKALNNALKRSVTEIKP